MCEDNNKSIDKILAEIKKSFINNKSSEEKNLCTLIGICSFNLLILVILFLLLLHYKALSSDLVAKVFSALIAVIGVFAGFYFNKKQTYKEIVTKERINWLHKIQEALAKFLALTSKDTLDEDDKKTARKLYYLIISNLNVKEEVGKKNDRKAVESLYTYARSKKLDVELNFDREINSNNKTDSKCTESHDEKEKEIEKLKKDIENLENKIKILENNGDTNHLAGLRRKEIISEYTKIFNETWNRIKEEAD
ncbi:MULTISPECIES: hypothetical protein [Peptoniphilus]|uniref:hypothetical protein n=1 Tax=Peptoniphilus TaxID=162289 RepID=UPI0023547FC4|nr:MULTISPECIES: hypothetical protein [Peptoniphilus]MDU1043611.1 hypothetical protein [Peptoniphilus rhinitidis]MDU1954560.1 hypothetical protein [Peptoniphilus lacydonensis]MDU5377134.1 hypothetical protein [Peptoniphilus lacydonensis]MDU5436546.1 hypothetical protein [Peptoniphilus lacydonensis]